jgi:hypothetical protein
MSIVRVRLTVRMRILSYFTLSHCRQRQPHRVPYTSRTHSFQIPPITSLTLMHLVFDLILFLDSLKKYSDFVRSKLEFQFYLNKFAIRLYLNFTYNIYVT